MNNTEKIRGLLEKIASGNVLASDCSIIANQALSLLPPPCSECGGSGEKFLGITGRTDPVYETCPTCKGSGLKPSPCGNYDLDDPCDDCWGKGKVEAEGARTKPCQAPAGKELAKALKEDVAYDRKIGLVEISITLFNQILIHLEAQAKQNKDAEHALELAKTMIDTRAKQIEQLEGALVKIDSWAKAYPLKVFLEPDFKKAAEVLKAAGLTLDAISASNMRHVISGVKDIVDQALQKEIPDGK